MFLLLSSPVNHLTTPQVDLVTLCRVLTPRLGTPGPHELTEQLRFSVLWFGVGAGSVLIRQVVTYASLLVTVACDFSATSCLDQNLDILNK